MFSTVACAAPVAGGVRVLEAGFIRRAAELSDKSAGFTSPHPNFGCVIARGEKVVGEGFLYAQGTKCAELLAVEAAGGVAAGATAFLNLEPGDCHGDRTAVSALVKVRHSSKVWFFSSYLVEDCKIIIES